MGFCSSSPLSKCLPVTFLSNMSNIRILAYRNNVLWERLYVNVDNVLSKETSTLLRRKDFCDGDYESSSFEIVSHQDFIPLSGGDQSLKTKNVKFLLAVNALEFSYFIQLLCTSRKYRNCVINYWRDKVKSTIPKIKILTLGITLNDPTQQVVDHKWNHRIAYLVMERSELDSAMSWLSTLGGAYSALGDEFSHCAQMAGRISLRQFHIALRLGDPSTVARCKLYIALSLIQTHRFKCARSIIEAQYHMAVNSSCPDIRLIRMCRGVWSKLRYEHSKYLKHKHTEKFNCH